MVALKGNTVERFMDRPDPQTRLVLVYGPDTGLVSERARAIATRLAESHQGSVEPFDADSAGDTGALFDAATSLSLFGGQQVIHVRPTAKQLGGIIGQILRHDGGAPLVVEAGDLKPSSPLRKLADKESHSVSIACYVDTAKMVGDLIDAMCQEAKLQIEPDARNALLSLLGGDRLATRGELAKLRDYCGDESTVSLDDVLAICGDASAYMLDDLSDAVGLGDGATADHVLRRCIDAGTAIPAAISALSRHFQQLRAARIAIDDGATAESAMGTLRPPVFFKRQTTFKRQMSQWRRDAIDSALGRIHAADSATRLNAQLDMELASRLVLSLSATAARRR